MRRWVSAFISHELRENTLITAFPAKISRNFSSIIILAKQLWGKPVDNNFWLVYSFAGRILFYKLPINDLNCSYSKIHSLFQYYVTCYSAFSLLFADCALLCFALNSEPDHLSLYVYKNCSDSFGSMFESGHDSNKFATMKRRYSPDKVISLCRVGHY